MFPVAFWLGRRRPLCRVPVLAVAVCHVSASQAVEGSLRRSGAVERPGARAERRRMRGARRRRPTDARAPSWGGFSILSPGAVLLVVFGAFERVCVVEAKRAYVWCGLHRCRVVACGTGGRCPCLVGCPSVVGDCSSLVSAVVMPPQSLRCAVGSAGVKATCQVSRSPEAPACATRGLAPVGLLEVLSELLRRGRVRCRVPVGNATGILSRSQRRCPCRLLIPVPFGCSGGLVAVVVTTFPRDVPSVPRCPSCPVITAWLCLVSVGIVGLALGRPVFLVVPARCSLDSVVPFVGASPWWHRRVWLPDLAVYPGSGVVLLVGPRLCGDPWVATRTSGPGGDLEGRVVTGAIVHELSPTELVSSHNSTFLDDPDDSNV
ncbi:hypothetical protein Taro_002939 [Colocasia esculenta]|uniref:Secreted protein n=1 Tax=Colocasia esculenta TaxID=4460 RepID=A0A843TQC0_COLES|nr:hypothetical protein [Colocasia esculenta]